MNRTIHIVCLDAPSPPDYGGAIDMYYTIQSMANAGNEIILHYFDYKENRNAGKLEKICKKVFRYSRKSFLQSVSFSLPYIVSSRINQELIRRLNEDDHPILLEGLHCTGIIAYLHKPSRVVVRMHNEEESYYRNLRNSAASAFRRLYFSIETYLISKYQRRLNRDITLACLSEKDLQQFRAWGFQHSGFVPCFIPWQNILSQAGSSRFCLYHGNMAISENEKAALWLIQNIFNDGKSELVIAGNRMPQTVMKAAGNHSNIRLVNDPSMPTLEELIREAHVHVLPSMNETGVKLKLLHALFTGRFCLTNTPGIEGSGISAGVEVVDGKEEFRE